MSNKVNAFLRLFLVMLLGVVLGVYAQTNSRAKLSTLSEERADVSKMDLILLNTRIAVLQQMLKDDLSLPLVPTSISYDADKQKIRTSVYVDPAFLAKTNPAQLSKALESRATNLCVAPALAERNFRYLVPVGPPDGYCAISFFTHSLDAAGHVQTKEVASFDGGQLTVR